MRWAPRASPDAADELTDLTAEVLARGERNIYSGSKGTFRQKRYEITGGRGS
jgi:hypothetical protein